MCLSVSPWRHMCVLCATLLSMYICATMCHNVAQNMAQNMHTFTNVYLYHNVPYHGTKYGPLFLMYICTTLYPNRVQNMVTKHGTKHGTLLHKEFD